jgi:SAM-dependent methyltransferase
MNAKPPSAGFSIKSLLSFAAKSLYTVPRIGVHARCLLESSMGRRDYQSAEYWNGGLSGWAASYMGGTLSIDVRNAVTVSLARQLCPGATSILDLGCAGGTLVRCLDRGFETYSGVDISDYAISKAREEAAGAGFPPGLACGFEASSVEAYQPGRQYDVIVFNEVMYYLDLAAVSETLRRYADHLYPEGVIVVSLKDHEQCRCLQEVLCGVLEFSHGVLFQEQSRRTGWKILSHREMPAFLIQGFRKHG